MEIWNLILLKPILNFLIILSNALFNNFGLAIIVLTVIVRLVILPLTLKQLRASRALAEKTRELHPKLQQIQKKYAKDKQRLSQETMKLYKEVGISPLGCLSSPMLISMLIQFPVWIALYQSIIRALAVTPQDLLGLSQYLYSWSVVNEALPMSGHFLWLNLAKPDPYLIIPLLVMATMWVSQKMISTPAADPQQQSMQNMMQWLFPLMFGFITFTLPSGLGLYFVVSAIFSIVTQYYIYGWGNLFTRAPAKQTGPKQIPLKGPIVPGKSKAEIAAKQTPKIGEGVEHGKSGSKREDSGGSNSAST